MNKQLSIHRLLIGAVLALTIGLAAGCHNSPSAAAPPAATSLTPKPQSVPIAPAEPDTKPVVSKTPVKDRVETFLDDQSRSAHPLLPSGVRLLHADLTEGVVTLDFSSEFNNLANMGDSVEGRAQKELCAVLAPIPSVEKLRVTVEGKSFDSQNTDWNTPFPVRGATASTAGGGNQE